LTDNGPEFVSSRFENVIETMGCVHHFTTPRWPSSNRAIERVNRTIQGLLRSLTNKPGSWDEYLPQTIISYNNTMHVELKMAPAAFLLGLSHEIISVPFIDAKKLNSHWQVGNHKFKPFKLKQEVLLKIHPKGNLNVNKLTEKYQGTLYYCLNQR